MSQAQYIWGLSKLSLIFAMMMLTTGYQKEPIQR